MLKFLRMGNKRTKTLWWILIVVTVVTFLGGFVFLVGVGLDTSLSARSRGDLGTVNGAHITRTAFANALDEQRQAFLQQTGSDPDPEEMRALETQAWRALVTRTLVTTEARRLGLKATDREVMLSLQSEPPRILAQEPTFQTDGKFDPQKYVSALRDPNNNWAPFEEMAREQLPLRKLQDRLRASLKLSEPELRQAYRDRFERIGVTVLQIGAAPQANVPAPTEAEVDRAYQKYRGRFASGPQTQLELLQIPIHFSAEEVRAAREQVQGLADRVRRGEDFATLVRDYSEGPGAARGGEINRVFQPREFGPALEAKMAALQPGELSEPFQDGPYWLVLKVISRIPDPVSAVPNLRVAQLAIRIRAGESSMSEQVEKGRKIRDKAARIGLGKAAAENGMATGRTPFYDYGNAPPELLTIPEAADWGLSAKQGAVSHVIQTPQEFVIAQVAAQRAGGIPSKEEVAEPLRQIVQQETRIGLARPAAQKASEAIAAGARLEDAAKAVGANTFTVDSMSRAQPDQRLAQVPEVVGAAFAAPPGRTFGPIETLAGWYFVRVDKHTPADPAAYEQSKLQITQDIMGQRQQAFFTNWVAELRSKAKVQDLRGEAGP